MQNKEKRRPEETPDSEPEQRESDITAENADATDEKTVSDNPVDHEARANELNDKYLRLYSEFDNYRRRTVKERADLIKTAGEDVFKAILPVIDDFERAMKANENVEDAKPIKEGIQLIYNKLKNTIQQKGLIPLDSVGQTFNPDVMEAITHIEAPDESQKGKVIDEVEKGYKLGEKVIRYAKVIVAK